MNSLIAIDMTVGALMLTLSVLYAAWHEYRASNLRDAKLLTAVGSLGLIGSAMTRLQ